MYTLRLAPFSIVQTNETFPGSRHKYLRKKHRKSLANLNEMLAESFRKIKRETNYQGI